jgi:hypothetical protein
VVVLDVFVYFVRCTLLGGQPSRLLLAVFTKQGASDAEKEHIRNCQTSEQNKNSHIKTVNLNTCVTALQNQPKKELAAAVVAM